MDWKNIYVIVLVINETNKQCNLLDGLQKNPWMKEEENRGADWPEEKGKNWNNIRKLAIMHYRQYATDLWMYVMLYI